MSTAHTVNAIDVFTMISLPMAMDFRKYFSNAYDVKINNWFEVKFHHVFDMKTGERVITCYNSETILSEKVIFDPIPVTANPSALALIQSQWATDETYRRENVLNDILISIRGFLIKSLRERIHQYKNDSINYEARNAVVDHVVPLVCRQRL